MLISLRIPDWLLERIDGEAAGSERSRNYVITKCLEREFNPKHELSGRGVEGNAKGQTADHLSITSSRRDKMGARNAEQVSSPAAPTKSCPDCGALNGHQKWCKAR